MALFDDASLVVTPNGYKAGTLYSIKPTSGAGDMDVVRATTATRVNSAGLIESVAINVPRLDYTDSTCPRLLVEPQRTNLLKYSEQFDNAAWTKLNGTITANSVTSPDGTINADKLVEDTSTGNHRIVNSAFPVSNGTAYSQSWYVKYFNNQWVQLNRGQEGSGYLNFDLINGVVGNTGGITNYEISVMPNGWYRISINYVVTGTFATAGISILKTNINARYESYVGDGTSGVYIWGCQYEQSSYPTSYIPTTTAAVTRNADVISKTGISSLIGQTEGTLYAEVDLSIQSEAGLFRRILMISNGTETDSTYLRVTSGNIVQFVSFDGTVQTLINSISSISGNVKIAATYKTNEFKLYINGVLQGTDLLGSIPATRSILRVGNSDALISAHNLNDRIELATLFQTALTNDQCIDLTT
jgi:hypothetical protein